MSTNPYETPQPADGRIGIPGQIRFQVFQSHPWAMVFSARRHMDKLRTQAEEFVNSVVGTENVVSITENNFNGAALVVWYRSNATELSANIDA